MATVTPNNSWPVPTSTDYVKDGATAIEALGDAIDTSVGTGLLAWTAYTPTFTNLTVGNGTIDFKFVQIGKTVHARGSLVFGSTTTVTGSIIFSTPVAAITAGGNPHVANATMNDSGTATFTGHLSLNNTTNFQLQAQRADATYTTRTVANATVPFTWTTNDAILFFATYQAA